MNYSSKDIAAHTIQGQMNNELERTWKETVVRGIILDISWRD
jgi:hypothetical protein